ncbi:MAG TPA: glycosyl hydrolase family 28-related protein [Puia sp.]|nr:glycosyl hydrolase family 28-related protein [Puia sp.]
MKHLLLFFMSVSVVHALFAQDNHERPPIPQADNPLFFQKTLSELRSRPQSPPPNNAYYITDPGKQGLFIYDPTDKVTPDDSTMTLVTAEGYRFKRSTDQNLINVRWFGATGNGSTDDWYAIQKGISYIINNDNSGRTLYFPPGTYKISRPLIIARLKGATYGQASINLQGPANARTVSAGYANIVTAFNNTFAIGIEIGKGVLIKDLIITGLFTFPHTLNPTMVDTLAFSEWTDKTVRDNQLSPYAGIVIDPFSDSAVYANHSDMYPGLHNYYPAKLGRGGSTNVQIVGCSIQNFIVGVMITPSNQQNGELIDVTDCDISYNKVAYAMGQAQSKECHVTRLKCWGPTHTIFDNISYGWKHGDGAAVPMVDGVNIAGSAMQLCNIRANSFSGVFRNVYAEGLFRLGYVGGKATVSFEDCQIDFSTLHPGVPYPDFYVLGSGAVFHDCMLRLYPGVKGARLILSGTNNHYEGGNTNAPPVSVNLENNGIYPNPSFRNMTMFYSGGILGDNNYGAVAASSPLRGSNGFGTDPVYFGNTYLFRNDSYGLTYLFTYKSTYERTAILSGRPVIHADKSNWTAYFKLTKASDTNLLRIGDFILTSGLRYLDQFRTLYAPTYPVGFILGIDHDTVRLANLANGINDGIALRLWTDYYVNATPPLTGDIADGSNVLVNVQGEYPSVGDRLDIPMLPVGSYITSANEAAKTISFSNSNNTGLSFKDYTFINGYPAIEMYSPYDPSFLQRKQNTLIGGADFYQYEFHSSNNYGVDNLMNGAKRTVYRIMNTNIRGDTSLHKLNYVRTAQ